VYATRRTEPVQVHSSESGILEDAFLALTPLKETDRPTRDLITLAFLLIAIATGASLVRRALLEAKKMPRKRRRPVWALAMSDSNIRAFETSIHTLATRPATSWSTTRTTATRSSPC